MQNFSKLLKNINFDTTSVFIQRAWQAVTGIITVYFIARYLSSLQQGYYYTFASIAALYMLLELGLSSVLVQVSSHEFANLKWGIGGNVIGISSLRFLSFIKKSFIWYTAAACIFLMAYPFGLYFFSFDYSYSADLFGGAWLSLVGAVSLNLLTLPILSILEGTGKVSEIYLLRTLQNFIGSVSAWIILYLGGGLYAMTAIPFVSFLIFIVWIFLYKKNLLLSIIEAPYGAFPWLTEVFPMQWRLGISWICGYFLVQIHTPILFKYQGPVVAGQMGLTFTIVNMMSLLSMAVVTSNIPKLGNFAFNGNKVELNLLFKKIFIQSCLLFLAISIVFLLIRSILSYSQYDNRFLSFYQTLGLIVAVFFSNISGLLAVYIRAHKIERFVYASLIGATLTFLGSLLVAPNLGVNGIILILLLVNGVFGIPVSFYIYRNFLDLKK